MKLPISQATDLSNTLLQKWGFSAEEANFMTENFLEGELTNKKSHGLVRLPWIKQKVEAGLIAVTAEEVSVVKETPVSLLIDGKNKTGFFVVNKVLEMGIQKAKLSGIAIVGVTNTAATTGVMGLYARKAAEENLISFGFTGSPATLVPYGSIEKLWGTNPLSIGIPTHSIPFILDMASTKVTFGSLLVAKATGKPVPEGVALDKDGNPTTDVDAALLGGILPFEGHKGSGLGMAVALLAGPLVKSMASPALKGGWGTMFILIDPSMMRDLKEFKDETQIVIDELKNSKKQKGFEEIFYPGEKSQKLRQAQLEKGIIEVDDKLWESLQRLMD